MASPGKNYGRGAKAGAISGVVLGVILAVLYYIVFLSLTDTIKSAIGGTTLPSGVSIDQVFALALTFLVVGVVVGSIIIGVILGVVFAAVHNMYMKGQSLAMRGLVFGVIIWLIGLGFNVSNFYYGTAYVAASVVIGLVASLIYGYLLGTLYGRGGPKPVAPSAPTM